MVGIEERKGEREREIRAYESILNIPLVDELESLLIGKEGRTTGGFSIKKEKRGRDRKKNRTCISIFLPDTFSHLPPSPPFFHREYTTTSRMHKHCRNLGNTEATNLVHDCLHTESACMRIFTRRGYVHTYVSWKRVVGSKRGEGKRKNDLEEEGRRMKRRRGEEERSRVERINATTTERAVLRILRCNGTVRTQHVGSGLSRLASRLFDN